MMAEGETFFSTSCQKFENVSCGSSLQATWDALIARTRTCDVMTDGKSLRTKQQGNNVVQYCENLGGQKQ